MVSVPERAAQLVLASTTKLTTPVPVPLLPAVMLIQPTSLAAVHAQTLDEVITLKSPLALPGPTAAPPEEDGQLVPLIETVTFRLTPPPPGPAERLPPGIQTQHGSAARDFTIGNTISINNGQLKIVSVEKSLDRCFI